MTLIAITMAVALAVAAGWHIWSRRFCVDGHDWRRLYGDEIHHAGARYLCRRCPAHTDDIGEPA